MASFTVSVLRPATVRVTAASRVSRRVCATGDAPPPADEPTTSNRDDVVAEQRVPVARHWSRKLNGAKTDVTRDDLRYMDTVGIRRRAERGSLEDGIVGVLRDGDNRTLVSPTHIVIPFLADALEVDHITAAARLETLCALLPPLRARIGVVGVPALAALASNLPKLTAKLVALTSLFPSCNVVRPIHHLRTSRDTACGCIHVREFSFIFNTHRRRSRCCRRAIGRHGAHESASVDVGHFRHRRGARPSS